MKLNGATFSAKLRAVCLTIPLLLSGCQSLLSDSTSVRSDINVQEKDQSVTTGVQTLEVKPPPEVDIPNLPPDKIVDNQLNPEIGKPKEEANVPDLTKPQNISTLKPVYTVDKGGVAITIDDGPTRYTKELLKVLRENDTKVTFFLSRTKRGFLPPISDRGCI
ncbi:polysaccharide deacetylase family protein [Paenibacillus periandrae]|uniref:polysaccharide deacetylase family protein n=1 Tax=Paenibacillus periandrae TaxID=1761741 RepID=UPI0023DE0866|nr:polysaccharide deacetylase family protein [Paenibacillus periandrae]